MCGDGRGGGGGTRFYRWLAAAAPPRALATTILTAHTHQGAAGGVVVRVVRRASRGPRSGAHDGATARSGSHTSAAALAPPRLVIDQDLPLTWPSPKCAQPRPGSSGGRRAGFRCPPTRGGAHPPQRAAPDPGWHPWREAGQKRALVAIWDGITCMCVAWTATESLLQWVHFSERGVLKLLMRRPAKGRSWLAMASKDSSPSVPHARPPLRSVR